MMVPNKANTCIQCLKAKIDISEGISKQIDIEHCKECNRYKRNNSWIVFAMESPEFLGYCLKKVAGINKGLKLVDSTFLWTEPHCRRVKVKLTLQKEVMHGTILQKE